MPPIRAQRARASLPRSMPRVLAVMAATALPALSSTAARAQLAPPSAALPDAEVTRRLIFIEERLGRGTAAANRWWYGWFSGWTALSATEAVIALATTDSGLRKDTAVGAVASSLAVVPFGLFAFPARYAAHELSTLPEATPEERRRKLARAEHLLEASASPEALAHSWMTHVLTATTSIGVGLVLGVGYKRPATGVVDAAGGILLNEAQIYTQPTGALDAWKEYQAQTGRVPPGKSASSSVQWAFVPQVGGLGLAGRF